MALEFDLKQRAAVEALRRRPYNADSLPPLGGSCQGLRGLRQEITRGTLVPKFLSPLHKTAVQPLA